MYKVLFLVNSLTHKAGTERVVCLLANSMVNDLKYSVSILNRDTSRDRVAFDLEHNVQIASLSGNVLQFIIKIQKYIDNDKPNIIVVHNMGRLSLLCSILKLPVGVNLISLEHVAFESRPNWIRFLYRYRAKKFNKIITLTEPDALIYKEFHPKVFTIPNISPFDVNNISNVYPIDSKKIIAVGRFTYQKNFQDIIKAWELVCAHYQKLDWVLEIYGSGEDREELLKIINNRKLKNIELKGVVKDIQSVYSQASFYVMSSRFEGLPMVLIEAQSYGLPIVSYDCPHGPSDIIVHEENGLLIENQNPNELANGILKLIDSPLLREKMSKNAKQHAKRYSQEKILQLWQNLFHN